MSQISATYCIPADHPSFAGHFPDTPIVAGVILLDYARLLLQTWQPNLRIKSVSQAKFLQPLAPEMPFTVTLQQLSEIKIKFECLHQSTALIYGTFIVETKL